MELSVVQQTKTAQMPDEICPKYPSIEVSERDYPLFIFGNGASQLKCVLTSRTVPPMDTISKQRPPSKQIK